MKYVLASVPKKERGRWREMKYKRSDKGGITIDQHSKKKSYGVNGGCVCVGVKVRARKGDRNSRTILLCARMNQSGSAPQDPHSLILKARSGLLQEWREKGEGGRRREGQRGSKRHDE